MLEMLLQQDDKEERCGLVLLDDTFVEIPNIANDRVTGYYMDPEQVLPYLTAEKIKGTWHTHPNGPPILSEDDMEGFLGWPHLTHYIVGREKGENTVRSYKIDRGAVIECA